MDPYLLGLPTFPGLFLGTFSHPIDCHFFPHLHPQTQMVVSVPRLMSQGPHQYLSSNQLPQGRKTSFQFFRYFSKSLSTPSVPLFPPKFRI